MAHLELATQSRTITGKKVRNLRRQGVVPIVVYGGNIEGALSLQVGEKVLQSVLRDSGTSRVIDLKIDGKRQYPVLARTVSRHPTRNNLLHADFLAVRLDQTVKAEIPIKLVGSSSAVGSNAAVLMQTVSKVVVEALPEKLPVYVEGDISPLEQVGHRLSVSNLKSYDGVKILTDPKMTIVHLIPPRRIQLDEVEQEEEQQEETEEQVS